MGQGAYRALSPRHEGSYIGGSAPPIVRDGSRTSGGLAGGSPPSDWPSLCMSSACRRFAIDFALALEEIRVDIGSRDLARQFQLPADAEGRQAQLRLFRSEGGRSERARRCRPLAVLAEGAARKPAAARRWAHRHLRRHSRRGRVAGDAEERARDRLPPGARADAGLHRRSRRGRSCRNARRHARAWRRPAQDQSAGSRRPRHRSFGDGRHVRHGSRVPRQCREGI